MIKDANFLCEIGTEEIPAGYIPPALNGIKDILSSKLKKSRIEYADIDLFATPRRIAIFISHLAERQLEEEVEIKGPSLKAAYDAGKKPTRALEGFLKGNRVDLKDTFTVETDKGEYIYARKKLESSKTVEIIPELIDGVVKEITFPKQMKWSDKGILFPRPIVYFLVLFNDKVVEYEMDGIKASNSTRGHYIQHDQMLEIKKISDYEKILEKNGVIVDQNRRKELIAGELQKAAESVGGVLIEDKELLDTVTFLVENPHIAVCEFNSDFLRIPDIVLIAEMKEHQKYFSVADRNGKLTKYFLVTSNNPVNENVKIGNVRVITARFNDAGFFYDEDSKLKLEERVESLKNVLFHKDLGSIYDKVIRMQGVAGAIVKELGLDAESADKIERAILLSKTDLVTSMVIEFSSLQGKVGRIYALNDGEENEVADAINEHYKPRSQDDEIPTNVVSIVASLSEKIDNIFGSFSVGNIPKGSQDPYALRRQANAIVDILISSNMNLELKTVLKEIAGNYKNGAGLIEKIIDFLSARAKTIFSDRGLRYDEIDACLSTESSDYTELFRVAKSLNEYRKKETFSEMLLGFKRMNNIVTQFRKKNENYNLKFDESKLVEKEEKDLYSFFKEKSGDIDSYISKSSYIELFNFIIEGKNLIDGFFDKVLVMDKDISLRDNRLSMIEEILGNFTGIMDFSKISDS
jgi:glycyl-tRNA synthetase beta chain